MNKKNKKRGCTQNDEGTHLFPVSICFEKNGKHQGGGEYNA